MTGEEEEEIMMVCPPHSQMSKYSGGEMLAGDSNVTLGWEIQRKINFLSGLMRKQTMERDIITR